MALITCPGCDREVSDRARTCPHCGSPIVVASGGDRQEPATGAEGAAPTGSEGANTTSASATAARSAEDATTRRGEKGRSSARRWLLAGGVVVVLFGVGVGVGLFVFRGSEGLPCAVSESPQTGSGECRATGNVDEATVVVAAGDVEFTALDPAGTSRFTYRGATPLEANSVVVTETETGPYYGRVISIDGDEITTEAASLMDVFTELDLEVTVDDVGNIESDSAGGPAGLRRPASAPLPTSRSSLARPNLTKLDCDDGSSPELRVDLELDPGQFNAIVEFDRQDGLTLLDVSYAPRLEVGVEASFEAEVNCEASASLFSARLPTVRILVSFIPVWVTQEYGVDVEAAFQASGAVTVGASVIANAEVGVRYQDQEFDPYSSGSVELVRDPSIDVQSAATLDLPVRYQAALYGMVAFEPNLGPFIELEVEPLQPTWLELDAGVRGSISVTVDLPSPFRDLEWSSPTATLFTTPLLRLTDEPPPGNLSSPRAVVATIGVGVSPERPVAAYDLIWVANSSDGTVSVIDPATHVVLETITVGDLALRPIEANGLLWGSRQVLPPNDEAGHVWVIEPATRSVIDTIEVARFMSGPTAAYGLIWISSDQEYVSVIDPAARTVIDNIAVGFVSRPIAAYDLIWVTKLSGEVRVIDPSTLTVTATIPVGERPLVATAASDLIWVPSLLDDTVSVIDPITLTVTDTITVGDGPWGLTGAFDLIWVANSNDGTVSVIDPTTRAVVDTITVGDSPRGPVAAHGLVWVANGDDGTVSVIDGTVRAVIDTIDVGWGPQAPIAAYDLIWVANGSDNTVSVIDPNLVSGATAIETPTAIPPSADCDTADLAAFLPAHTEDPVVLCEDLDGDGRQEAIIHSFDEWPDSGGCGTSHLAVAAYNPAGGAWEPVHEEAIEWVLPWRDEEVEVADFSAAADLRHVVWSPNVGCGNVIGTDTTVLEWRGIGTDVRSIFERGASGAAVVGNQLAVVDGDDRAGSCELRIYGWDGDGLAQVDDLALLPCGGAYDLLFGRVDALPAPELVLRGDGVGVAYLGDETEAVLEVLTGLLGPALQDTGWYTVDSFQGPCDIREVTFSGGFYLTFGHDDWTGGTELYSYTVSEPTYRTVEGLGVGSVLSHFPTDVEAGPDLYGRNIYHDGMNFGQNDPASDAVTLVWSGFPPCFAD